VGRSETSVAIVGAGPAGLVVGCMLRDAGVDCTVVERQSRAHVESRARAGFLAANTVRVLDENGLADGLHANGHQHTACAFRGDGVEFELAYDGLGNGEVHTVYPQQDLVRDLVASFLDRGGEIQFDSEVVAVDGIEGDRPSVAYRAAHGELHVLGARYIAGCDGQHGVTRAALLAATPVRRYDRDHRVSWLAVLARAPQSMPATVYAIGEHGFAGHMARSATVTRYYLQCPRGEDPAAWSDDRIWDELGRRMRTDQFGPLNEGPIFERGVVDMSSTVLDPMQHGRLFLGGDSASLISPSAAKGANLAVMESEALAAGLVAVLVDGDAAPLARYTSDCLPRIWRAQEFSHWMINLLHGPDGDGEEAVFLRALQHARLLSLQSSRRHQDYFAENYVGI
jgi:p-hydroxybenzoate 3-monooxygenase